MSIDCGECAYPAECGADNRCDCHPTAGQAGPNLATRGDQDGDAVLTGIWGTADAVTRTEGTAALAALSVASGRTGLLLADGFGLEITGRVPSLTAPTDHNIAYLRAKQERMGHLLDLSDPSAGVAH